jgi:FlaA1/EpsC-like NDP-sugar epimerase
MAEFMPDLVVHCAAHKHVPLMEDSPTEAIKNNVIGTNNVIHSAGEHGVKRFVQLSTDKAVNPTNVMGASKRVTELIVQDYAKKSSMKCMTVRFGNVLGSYGSVIPLFESQIRAGGPVQVTHPDITRYFMTIPEAAQLVLQAGALGESGAIYVLNMGSPVRIMDLAEKLIRYYGYTPNEDMPIEIIGLRPGEKMYEELTLDEEEQSLLETTHNRIYRTQPLAIDDAAFPAKLKALMDASQINAPEMIDLLLELVPNYCCANKTTQPK